MWLVLPALPLLASLLSAADKPRKQPSGPPRIEVMEMSVSREDRDLVVEGRVRNAGQRPIRKLVLIFQFLAPGKETIAKGRGPAEEDVLEPGQSHEFRYHLPDNARAVWLLLKAEDATGDEPRVIKPGPYPIE
jgi:hypothetical protein